MRLIIFLLLAGFALPAFSQKGEKPIVGANCLVCGKGPLIGKIWVYKGTNYVCRECYKLETRCSLCGLPVREDYIRTSDGRIICKFDSPTTVLSIEMAREIFEETRRELTVLFKGVMDLKSPNISVNLFDVDYWNVRNREWTNDKLHRMGFSQTRRSGSEFFHSVILLGGRPRNEMMAVCAHEFAHLWLNENLDKSRNIELDTMEAICELVAYKLMVERNETEQQQSIKANNYTKGRIDTLIEADSVLGIMGILNWARNGNTETLDLQSLPVLKKETPPLSLYVPVPYEPPAPDKLVLKGLGGTRSKPVALINNRTFEKSEVGKIKLKSGTVSVRCLEIREDSVVISVGESLSPVTLKLEPSAK